MPILVCFNMDYNRFRERNAFYARIKPYRSDFITNPSNEENKVMGDHFQYLKKLMDEDKLYMAGPTLIVEDPFGLLLVMAESKAEARSLLEEDPSVKSGIQIIADLRPIRLSLTR